MKSTCILMIGLISNLCSFAQSISDLDLGITLSPGVTLAKIKDDLPEPSKQSIVSDGYTYIEENALRGAAMKLFIYYNQDDNSSIGSGLNYSKIRMNPRNQDGTYIGTSIYHVQFISLPLTYRYRSAELIDKLRFSGTFGPSINIKLKEEAIGPDYAHFMTFAQNRYDLDPTRGRNGSNKSMDLFGTLGISLGLQLGAEYSLTDRIYANAGVTYDRRITNLLNRHLIFNDAESTPIAETIQFRASLLILDIAVGYRLQ